MRDGPARVRLLDAPLDFSQEEQTLHGILDGRIVWQVLHRPDHLLLCGHSFSLPPPPGISNILSVRTEPKTIFLFSNRVVGAPFRTLLAGHVQTTYGTDFDCIAESILEKRLDEAIVMTDGYASLS